MEQSPSFLDAVGRGILESASSLDAHIDAESLVKRISHDFSPSSRRCQQALSELKDLCRRAPTAVVAAEGSVPAILRAISQLTPTSGGGEDVATEPLQDALEALGWLIGQGQSATAPGRIEDEAEARRAADVSELVVRHTENGKQLLRLLDVRDTSTQHDTIVLLQRVYHYQERLMSQACLDEPGAVIQLMTLLECPVDYVRNECLSFLLLLTASNSELQTIVTVQGLVEIIFVILEEEDLSRGGKVARDLLRCFMNLVGNVTCQKYIRETDGINSLVAAMSTALSGRRANANDEDDDGFAAADRIDIPEEVRWQCFDLLADATLALAGGSMKSAASSPGGSAADGATTSREAVANQEALVQKGALKLCKHLSDMQISLAPKLRLVELLEALEPNAAVARALQLDDGSGPLFSMLTAVVVGPSTVRPLRCALGRILGRAVARHEPLQHFLLDSLVPQMDFTPGEVQPAGRQLVGLLDEAAEGSAEPGRLWFGMHLLLAMLQGNADVQNACERKAVSIPSDAGPPETFLDLIFRAFSACARACRNNQARSGASLEQRSAEPAPASADPGPEPEAPAAALVAILKFLVYWLASCPAALVSFACSPSHLPLAMDLAYALPRSSCGNFFRVQVEGLTCLLLGICIKSESKDVEAHSLMGTVAKHIGIEEFQQKGERLWRSEPLQRPPRSLVDFRWYGGQFRTFIREQQRAAQRRMVQLYVSGDVGSAGGAALSEDVADHYKQLIRVQDSDLREVRKENEHLRREVESFMQRSLQASSAALVEKMEAVQAENDALHTEVEQLSSEREEQSRCLEEERRRFRNSVHELEQQLHSVAVGYEQVERGSEALSRENAELRAKLSVSKRSSGGDAAQQTEGLELEVAGAKQRIEELQVERADLLDLLGRIMVACPGARALVCPLGATSASYSEGAASGGAHLADPAAAIA